LGARSFVRKRRRFGDLVVVGSPSHSSWCAACIPNLVNSGVQRALPVDFSTEARTALDCRRGTRVRWVVPIAMLMAAAGWILCEAELSGFGTTAGPVPPVAAAQQWRRTKGGWEKTSAWQPVEFATRPPFHPGMLAAFEVWTAVAALVCTNSRSAKQAAAAPAC